MKDSLTMEVQGYFWGELSRLARELAVKEEEYRKVVEALRNLPFASHLERLLRPLLKWLLPRKVKKLRTEIANLREKIKQYKQAETELEEGKYGLTLIFLDELAGSFFYPGAPSLTLDFGAAGGTSRGLTSNLTFFRITELRKELDARMRGEVVARC